VLALALAISGCDFHGDPLVIEPEFDDATSFESDLGQWTPRSVGVTAPPVAWEIARSGERATDGTQSARLRVDNTTGQAKILLERRYEVEKNQRYRVEISFDFASADFGGVNLWQLLVGAGTTSAAQGGALAAPGDTGNGSATDQGFAWLPKSYSTEVISDADGELFVYVGVGATSEFSRAYHVDKLEVTLTRKGITTTRP
jgi:hypothetical protein